jgi:hypothetical protein
MRKGAAIFDSAADAEEYLAANYPECSALFAKNADVMKKIIKAEDGFTIFAPNGNAFGRDPSWMIYVIPRSVRMV